MANRILLLAALLGLAAAPALAAPAAEPAPSTDVTPYVERDQFEKLKISPDGEHLAATVPLADRTALVIMRRADNKVVGSVAIGRFSHVHDFWWVNDDRIVFSGATRIGVLDQPMLTGDLYATDVAGRSMLLVGQTLDVDAVGSNIRKRKVERVAAFVIDADARDGRTITIAVAPFGDDPLWRVEEMDVQTGLRRIIARAPVRNARFATDNAGNVRVAAGSGVDNASRLFLRDAAGGEWKLLNDENATGVAEYPLGFSADDRTLYLMVERKGATDAIVAYDVAAGTRREVLSDATSDPSLPLFDPAGVPVGALFLGAKPRTAFFDDASPTARQYRMLEGAFPGEAPVVTSTTRDGARMLVEVGSDRNPGDFFLFDPVAKKAQHVVSRRQKIDPERMSATTAVTIAARDGLSLPGFLTMPAKGPATRAPLVVMPHGGPFGPYDNWFFDPNVQMLANAGYAVLRVNFRGSGNYGRDFEQAGAKQWGGAMQDDLTDATRWAIAQGHADPARICIAGGSYGGYAALMGVAKEPSLYRCAIGNAGVYDLPMLHTRGDVQQRGSGENYLKDWVGTGAEIEGRSPAALASRIKAPVFLAAGGEDQRSPIEHSRRMERALRAAGVPVETFFVDTEGHGFYRDENRKAFAEKTLAFLARHIGPGAPAAAPPAPAPAAGEGAPAH